MFGGLNWEVNGRPGGLEAGLKVAAGLNWFVWMNCGGCWPRVLEAGEAWLMLTICSGPAGPN